MWAGLPPAHKRAQQHVGRRVGKGEQDGDGEGNCEEANEDCADGRGEECVRSAVQLRGAADVLPRGFEVTDQATTEASVWVSEYRRSRRRRDPRHRQTCLVGGLVTHVALRSPTTQRGLEGGPGDLWPPPHGEYIYIIYTPYNCIYIYI